MRQNKRITKTQALLDRQNNFISRWSISTKPPSYNSLDDKHVEYHFELPSVQKHFKRIRRKYNNQQPLRRISDLVKRIEKSNFIFNQVKEDESFKRQEQEPKKVKQNMRYARKIKNYSSIDGRYRHQDKNSQSLSFQVPNEKSSLSFSQIISRYSNVRRLPSIQPEGISERRKIYQSNAQTNNYIMEQIIHRRRYKNIQNCIEIN